MLRGAERTAITRQPRPSGRGWTLGPDPGGAAQGHSWSEGGTGHQRGGAEQCRPQSGRLSKVFQRIRRTKKK